MNDFGGNGRKWGFGKGKRVDRKEQSYEGKKCGDIGEGRKGREKDRRGIYGNRVKEMYFGGEKFFYMLFIFDGRKWLQMII